MIGPVHYRFTDQWDERGVITIECEKWVPVKETPAGFWLVRDFYYRPEVGPENWYHKSYLRWAPKDCPVRITPSLEKAKLDFVNRKYNQLRIIEAQFERCQKVNTFLDRLGDAPLSEFGHACGMMGE